MPTVPRLQRQVSATPLPAARLTAALTPQAAGVGVAEARADQALQEGQASARTWGAVSNLADTAFKHTVAWGQIIIQEKERADQVAVMEAENQLLLRMNKMEIAALSQKGKNAMGVPESTLAEYNKAAGEIDATLTTPRQKYAFSRVKSNRGAQLDMTLRRHTLREMDAYEAGELKSSVELNVNGAIGAYNDPALRDYNISNAVRNVQLSGTRLGLSDEQVKAETLKVTTAAHVGVVEQYINRSEIGAAKAYFDGAVEAGQISGDAQARVTKALEAGTAEKQAQDEFDRIIGEVPEDQWIKAARDLKHKDYDPAVRNEVERRLEHQLNVNKTVTREAHEAEVTEGKNTIDKTGNYLSIPLEQRLRHTVSEASALQQYAENKTAKGTIKTDQGTYTWLYSLATSEDAGERRRFVETGMTQYLSRLSPSDYQELLKLQSTVRKGDTAAAHALMVNPQTQTAIVNERIRFMGFDPTPSEPGTKTHDEPNQQLVLRFREQVRLKVAAHEFQTGKTATDADVREIVDDLSTEVVKAVPDTWRPNLFGFGEQPARAQFAFETQAPPRTFGDVPAAWQAEFNAKFKTAHGRTPLDREILAAYNAIVPQ